MDRLASSSRPVGVGGALASAAVPAKSEGSRLALLFSSLDDLINLANGKSI